MVTVGATCFDYENDRTLHKPPSEATEEDEARREAPLDRYDDAVEAALKAPAPNAAAMRWKLSKLEEIYREDTTWDEIDRILPHILGKRSAS